eukprot:scpid73500/ scgid15768/ 
MKTIIFACLAACLVAMFVSVHTAKLGDAHSRVARSSSDSSSDSSSSDSGSDSASESASNNEECFMTQTCETVNNVLSVQQPEAFTLINGITNLLIMDLGRYVTSTERIIAGANSAQNNPPDPGNCFDEVQEFSGQLLLIPQGTLGFQVMVSNSNGDPLSALNPVPTTNLDVSYILTGLPASFGVLQVDFQIDAAGDLGADPPVPRFQDANTGEVFDLVLTREICSLGLPLVCGIMEPTDPAPVPTLPNAVNIDLNDAAISANNAVCPDP